MSELQSYAVESIANGSCHAVFGISFCYLRFLFGSEVVGFVPGAVLDRSVHDYMHM